jgi:CRAL/TRIO domain
LVLLNCNNNLICEPRAQTQRNLTDFFYPIYLLQSHDIVVIEKGRKRTKTYFVQLILERRKIMSDVDVTFVRCQEILEYYVVKATQPDQADACRLVDEYIMSAGGSSSSDDDDIETVAETSYAYWYYRRNYKQNEVNDSSLVTELLKQYRRAAAVREASRHLEGETFDDAVTNLKKTIEFHSTHQTTTYRDCCSMTTTSMTKTSNNLDNTTSTTDSVSSVTSSSTADNNGTAISAAKVANLVLLRDQRRTRIQQELTSAQTYCVRGHDREDRAVIFAYPRKVSGGDDESFVDTIVYTMERAVACSEYTSGGKQEKIVCVLDSRGSASPSMKACKEAVNILQNHYPGRLKNLIILNPPFVLMTIYNMIKPFLDPDTRSKFIIVKSDKQKIAEISKLVDVSQAMPAMLPGGQLTSDVDPKMYLFNIPFHRLYDDGGNDDDLSPNTTTSVTLVKKASFIKTLAVGEIRVDDELEHVVVVDPIRS